MEKKEKRDTGWYDDLCLLYQKTKIPELRNVLWEQVKLFLYARVRDFVKEKRAAILKRDPDLVQQIYQEIFFVFQKACDIWNPARKTKFLTFLGAIVEQELLNIVRLNLYHKTRDYKIRNKLMQEEEGFLEVEDIEKNELLDEIRLMFENFNFERPLERDIVSCVIYGKEGNWRRLQKKSGLSIEKFYKLRTDMMKRLKDHILANCTPDKKDLLQEMLGLDSLEGVVYEEKSEKIKQRDTKLQVKRVKKAK